MIEIDDIKDEASLKAWLTEWPAQNGLDEESARAVAVSIAHRAAMRVLPLWWGWTPPDRARKGDLSALPVLRCNLISGVAAKIPTPEIVIAAAAASAYADADTYAADAATYAAAYAAAATYSAAYAAAATTAAATYAATHAVDIGSAAVDFWKSTQSDCETISEGKDVFAAPLWADHKNPFEKFWQNIKTGKTAPEWSFWIKWYDDALAGNPPNWKMLEQIALIDLEVWEDGAEAVAGRIAEILDEYGTEGERLDTNASPGQALVRNANVIRLQLDTLMVFVEEEIQRLRGPNDIPESVMARIVLLEGIVEAVKAMQSALADEAQSGGTALPVIEEKLPQIIDTADELVKQDGSPEVSETIVVMGATIEHLTKCGTPGYAALGIAVADMVFKTIKSWLPGQKPSNE